MDSLKWLSLVASICQQFIFAKYETGAKCVFVDFFFLYACYKKYDMIKSATMWHCPPNLFEYQKQNKKLDHNFSRTLHSTRKYNGILTIQMIRNKKECCFASEMPFFVHWFASATTKLRIEINNITHEHSLR